MANRYSFTFLRDPVERLLSFYYYCRTRDPNRLEHYELAQQLSLDAFLKLGFTDPNIKAHVWNYQVCQLAVDLGGWNDVVLTENDLLRMAIKHLDDFSYVGVLPKRMGESKLTFLKRLEFSFLSAIKKATPIQGGLCLLACRNLQKICC